MKLFNTGRPSAMTAARFPVPAQPAHAFAVGRTRVPGTPSVLLAAGQERMAGQGSAQFTAQRIGIQGRVLIGVEHIDGFSGGLDKANDNGTRPGAVQAASGVPPRGRPV